MVQLKWQYITFLIMSKKSKHELIKIDDNFFNKAVDLYWKWKELNFELKEFYTRGVNLHEGITEIICCYANDFELSIGGGSEDAINPQTKDLIQVKGSSNWNSDLTSFGPDSQFDKLHFVRLDASEDKMYLYDIPVDDLDDIMVNKNESVLDFKEAGKRPRFSIIEKCIEADEIEAYAVVDLNEREVNYLENCEE